MLAHVVDAVMGRSKVGPDGATFADGAAAARVSDAIRRSAAEGQRVTIASI
jgi:predicted dehydrogenase